MLGRIQSLLGFALLLAALLLSLPGVRVARAEEGPMCRAGQPIGDRGTVDRVAAALRARAQAEGNTEVRALNTRGYNYPRGSQVDPAVPARELKR